MNKQMPRCGWGNGSYPSGRNALTGGDPDTGSGPEGWCFRRLSPIYACEGVESTIQCLGAFQPLIDRIGGAFGAGAA